jgi:hypothetical protein
VTTIVKLAQEAIRANDSRLESKFVTVVQFLAVEPDLRPTPRGSRSSTFGSAQYLNRLAEAFVAGRSPRAPQPPSTVPDELVSVVLNSYFGVPKSDLKRAKEEHLLSMASENIVGNLLERYIANEIERHNWVWCSGEVVKSVDFVRAPTGGAGKWVALQVKNRDNSENSSSSAIRRGTIVEKWYRTKSRTGETMWSVFPDGVAAKRLSESGLQKFASEYLVQLRKDA